MFHNDALNHVDDAVDVDELTTNDESIVDAIDELLDEWHSSLEHELIRERYFYHVDGDDNVTKRYY